MGDHCSVATGLREHLGDGRSVDVLVRWLLAELAAIGVTETPRRAFLPGEEREEIVLDVEVDGERWCLTRCVVEPVQGPPPALSPREQEIARMVAKGYANKSIASVLDISSWTVSSHLRRIYAKLGVSSRAAMVARLLENGRDRGQPSYRQTSMPPRLPVSSVDARPT